MACSILLVEDDRTQARLVERRLSTDGFEVTICGTIQEASDALAEADWDLVVSDLFLPDGDGLSFCKLVRMTQGVPVVMISSIETEYGQDVLANEDGPQAFFAKPFPLTDLSAAVTQLLAMTS